MSTKLNKLKRDLKTAKAEEESARKTVEEAANDEDQQAASELLTVASKTVADIQAEIDTQETASKSGQDSPRKTSTSKQDQKKKSGSIVEVSCATQQRRRAGFKFGPVPVRISREDLADEQWEAINNDPMLKVVTLD